MIMYCRLKDFIIEEKTFCTHIVDIASSEPVTQYFVRAIRKIAWNSFDNF